MNETALGSVLVFAVLIATVSGWFKKGLDWFRKSLVGHSFRPISTSCKAWDGAAVLHWRPDSRAAVQRLGFIKGRNGKKPAMTKKTLWHYMT